MGGTTCLTLLVSHGLMPAGVGKKLSEFDLSELALSEFALSELAFSEFALSELATLL